MQNIFKLETEILKTKNEPKSKLHLLSKVWGIIVASLLLLIFGIKITEKFIEDGSKYLFEILKAIVDWGDDPTGFFFTYLIGYAVIWWKPLWGSILIILVSIFYVIINGIDGPPIFAIPTFLVGLLYLINWIVDRKNQDKVHEMQLGKKS